MLMETADVWIPLNDPTTGKLTDQELHLRVSFRACSIYQPRCDAVLVTNIPMAWVSQPAAGTEERRLKLRRVLELAFYGPDALNGAESPRAHRVRCPVCSDHYSCAAGHVREVYCPALEARTRLYQANPDPIPDNDTTWALVVVRNSADATAFVKAKYFRNDAFLNAAARFASGGTETLPNVEMVALDPTPHHDSRFKPAAGADRSKTPFALGDLPRHKLHDEVERHFSRYWSLYVTHQRVDGLLIVRVSNCTGLMWADKR